MEKDFKGEDVHSAYMQMHYYATLPKQIKGMVVEMTGVKVDFANKESAFDPAFVVNGAITVIRGKLNMPTLNYRQQFLERDISHFPFN